MIMKVELAKAKDDCKRVAEALRKVAKDLSGEWERGERSNVIGLYELVEAMYRVAEAVEG